MSSHLRYMWYRTGINLTLNEPLASVILSPALAIAIRSLGVSATAVAGGGELRSDEATALDFPHDLVATPRGRGPMPAMGTGRPLREDQLWARVVVRMFNDLRDLDGPRLLARGAFQKPAFEIRLRHAGISFASRYAL